MSLLNELEDVAVYLQKEDTFFYTMVYDPNQKTLLVDKGEIRVGPDYQAEIPPYISPGTCSTYPLSSIPLCPDLTLSYEENQSCSFGNRSQNLTTFTRPFLDGKCAQDEHKTRVYNRKSVQLPYLHPPSG